MPTFGGLLLGTTFTETLSGPANADGRERSTGGPSADFVTFPIAGSCPRTAVDSTFQVLLRLAGNDTFWQTAQMFELVRSPF